MNDTQVLGEGNFHNSRKGFIASADECSNF